MSRNSLHSRTMCSLAVAQASNTRWRVNVYVDDCRCILTTCHEKNRPFSVLFHCPPPSGLIVVLFHLFARQLKLRAASVNEWQWRFVFDYWKKKRHFTGLLLHTIMPNAFDDEGRRKEEIVNKLFSLAPLLFPAYLLRFMSRKATVHMSRLSGGYLWSRETRIA